jgi:Bacteriophage baseplate protein W
MRHAAAQRWQRPVRHRAVDYRSHSRYFQRAAPSSSGQPSHLRTNWHSAIDCRYANPRNRNMTMRYVDYPFHFDQHGRTADTTMEDHVRDMIEEVLFTAPGERVNRPDFGAGLLRMVFQPTSPEIAAALQFSIRASLQRWLGDLIEPQDVSVLSQDSTLSVTVQYVLRQTGQSQTQTFQRSGV